MYRKIKILCWGVNESFLAGPRIVRAPMLGKVLHMRSEERIEIVLERVTAVGWSREVRKALRGDRDYRNTCGVMF